MTGDAGLFHLDISSSDLVGLPTGPAHDDAGLRDVVEWFGGQANLESLFASVFRQSLDEVLDGQRTGRFDIALLEKTEKTYLGTKVEIVTRAAFELARGVSMDYEIAGHEVDAKFSLSGVWSIPKEAVGHLCLVMAARDRSATFDVGVVRIRPEILNPGRNQDQKATISKAGRSEIAWLCRGAALPRNLLLSLPQSEIEAIMSAGTGQKRINELLTRVQGTIIDRTTATTVAQQQDGMKRCRDARRHLAPKGTVILGHQNEGPDVARALGLPVPVKGTLLSVRLTRVSMTTDDRPAALIEGTYYAVARPGDPEGPAPTIRY